MPSRREALVGLGAVVTVAVVAEAWARISYPWRAAGPLVTIPDQPATDFPTPPAGEPNPQSGPIIDSLLTITLGDQKLRYFTNSSNFTETARGFVITNTPREGKLGFSLKNSLYRIGDNQLLEGPIQGIEFTAFDPNIWSYSMEKVYYSPPSDFLEKTYEVVGSDRVTSFDDRATIFITSGGQIRSEVFLAPGGAASGVLTSDQDIVIRFPYRVRDQQAVRVDQPRLVFNLNDVQIAYLYELYLTRGR